MGTRIKSEYCPVVKTSWLVVMRWVQNSLRPGEYRKIGVLPSLPEFVVGSHEVACKETSDW